VRLMRWKMRRSVVRLSILVSLLAISSRLRVLRPISSVPLVVLFVRPDISQARRLGDDSLRDDDVLRLIAESLLRMLFAQHQDHSSVSRDPHLLQSPVRLYSISSSHHYDQSDEPSLGMYPRVLFHQLLRFILPSLSTADFQFQILDSFSEMTQDPLSLSFHSFLLFQLFFA
jgi:hypothetical protein